MRPHRSSRPAFTLVELITVIAIIAALAALTAIFFPSFQGQESVNRGADQLQNWLLSAKMQAKRDGLPTGILLISNSPTTFSQFAYIQQPNPFAVGIYTGADTDPNPGATNGFPRAKFFLPPPMTFFDGSAGYTVQPGDYLEVFGGGVTHRIVFPVPTPPTPAPNPPSENAALILEPSTASTLPLTPPRSSAVNYRIIPQPQQMPGEQPLALPPNIAVSFETPLSTNANFTLSQNVPVRNTSLEILFSPSGAVVGQGTGTGQIVLWVRDTSTPMAASPNPDWLAGKGTLITIQPRTGFIAAHPVAPGTDPYLFIRDGRSSGL